MWTPDVMGMMVCGASLILGLGLLIDRFLFKTEKQPSSFLGLIGALVFIAMGWFYTFSEITLTNHSTSKEVILVKPNKDGLTPSIPKRFILPQTDNRVSLIPCSKNEYEL